MHQDTSTINRIVETNGGKFLYDGHIVRFDKILTKPTKSCKRLLVKAGYSVAPVSGAKWYPYIEYILED